MSKMVLSFLMVLLLTFPAQSDETFETGMRPRTNVVFLEEALARTAKPELGLAETLRRRALMNLMVKEKFADKEDSAQPANSSTSDPVKNSPHPETRRKRILVHLDHVPVNYITKALEDDLKEHEPEDDNDPRPLFVTEPQIRSVLLSGTPKDVKSLSEMIAKLDKPPREIAVDVVIAELLPVAGNHETDVAVSNDSAIEEAPNMKNQGTAWLAWAEKHHRIKVLSQPRSRSQEHQATGLRIGSQTRFLNRLLKKFPYDPMLGLDFGDLWEGLEVRFVTQISPEGLYILNVELERRLIVEWDENTGPLMRKTMTQTTISAKEDQTVILGGLAHFAEDDDKSLIISFRPHALPLP